MGKAKIRLSKKEEELITDAAILLTKNTAIEKIAGLLNAVQEKQADWLRNNAKTFPKEITETSPKISKGENYKGLPYLVLDYPRLFQKENIFAIRSFFWWGHFFSITLHVSGRYKVHFEKKITRNWKSWQEKGFYLCINDNEWEHHFDDSNYTPAASISVKDAAAIITKKSFLKLAKKIPLTHWKNAEDILTSGFKEIISALTD